MVKFFDKTRSLTFLCLYMKDGSKIYRSSRLKEDRISREMGIKGLRYRFIYTRYKGQFHTAIVFDNKTKNILERYDEYGKRIYHHTRDNQNP